MKKLNKDTKGIDRIKIPFEKKANGITLIALVVTIVVLLILAGITINMLFSENGIITKAREAAAKTKEAEENDIKGMQNMVNEMDKLISGDNTSGGTGEADPTKVANNIGSVISETENTDLTDAYNNKITIPAGFHIVSTSEDSTVSYTYSENGIPAVQDGIVVEDSDGNQFVWIPVGTINNKADDPNGPTTNITLARYTFNVGSYDITTKEWNGDGTIASTVADGDAAIETYYQELASSFYGNATANDIEAFQRQSNAKGGYYLARYEASYGSGYNSSGSTDAEKYANAKPLSQPSTASSTEEMSYTTGTLWNFIDQRFAAIVAKNMYTNDNFESDLVNSYAWDTAIVFIQTYSGDSDYSRESSLNNTLENTGERNNGSTDSTDKVCNIYDMASNASEWTTETSNLTAEQTGYCNIAYTARGGKFSDRHYYAAARTNFPYASWESTDYYLSFRVALCIL